MYSKRLFDVYYKKPTPESIVNYYMLAIVRLMSPNGVICPTRMLVYGKARFCWVKYN